MSIASRQRQADREKAAGITEKPHAYRGRKRRDGFVVAPFLATDEAIQAEEWRKKLVAANPHLRNRRRMFGNIHLTQKQRIAAAQLRREARQKNAEAAA